MNSCQFNHYQLNCRKSLQHGNVLVLFLISVVVMISMVAMALDSGHLLLNKGRLQNLVDAAALHAAKELDDGATHAEARSAALTMLQLNLAHLDFRELNTAINLSGADISSNQMTAQLNVTFSQRPDPFIVDGTNAARYVQVSLEQIALDNFLADIFNMNKQLTASAVAGPSTAIVECFNNLVPMLVCGSNVPETPDSFFGLPKGDMFVMKIGSNTSSAIGPGNFQLIRLGTNTGADDIRRAMAGEDLVGQACFSTGPSNGSVPTEPGNTVGPVIQGLNTRMGRWQGPVNSIDHPRDINVCQGQEIALNEEGNDVEEGWEDKAYRYNDYVANTEAGAACTVPTNGLTNSSTNALPPAEYERRVLAVVVGECDGETNGANNLDYLGAGCFFLTQDVEQSGQEAYVIGEFIEECVSEGTPSGDADDAPGPYTIVLYHTPDSTDS
mgnify:CR=1 FL=1